MKHLLDLLATEIRKAFSQYPVFGLLLIFLLVIWAIVLPAKANPQPFLVLTVVMVILGILIDVVYTHRRKAQNSRNHPRAVLFDRSHGQNIWKVPPTIDSGYKSIAAIAEQTYNLKVEELTEGETFNLEKLLNYAAFVLPIGPKGRCSLQKDELDAIKNYLNAGRGVLVLSTYTGDWHHEANLNKITDEYGIHFNRDLVMPPSIEPSDTWGHLYEVNPTSRYTVLTRVIEGDESQNVIRNRLLKDVQQIKTLSSCSLSTGQAVTVVLQLIQESKVFEPEPTGIGVAIDRYQETKKNGPVVLLSVSTSVKLVAAGSYKMFLNAFVDDPSSQNLQLFENILRWITES